MYENNYYTQEGYGGYGMVETVGRYTARTFLWMFAGLAVTFGVALAGYITGFSIRLLFNSFTYIGLAIAQIAVVIVLSARIDSLSVPAARFLFFAYAALTGVTFSVYFILFDVASLVLVFGVTALYFGAMAAFGYATKADLSRIRTVLTGGLIFLVAVGFLSLFIPGLQAMDRIYCLIGIAVFLGFTAYDTQKIKALHAYYGHDPEMAAKASVFAALQLYLDFINLFLYLLRFLGRRRD